MTVQFLVEFINLPYYHFALMHPCNVMFGWKSTFLLDKCVLHRLNPKTLLADKPMLTIFGTNSPRKVHCYDCCLVAGVDFSRSTSNPPSKLSFNFICDQLWANEEPILRKLSHTDELIQDLIAQHHILKCVHCCGSLDFIWSSRTVGHTRSSASTLKFDKLYCFN